MGRPKTFIPCYVCFKEFGSKSLTIHEPRCLERWRTSNKSLPAEKRPPTPVKPADWNTSQDSVCNHCRASVPACKRSDHTSVCATAKQLRSTNNSPDPKKLAMTGVVKADFSPKKGKENKNSSNHIPVPSIVKKNAKNEAKEKLEPIEKPGEIKSKVSVKQSGTSDNKVPEDVRKDCEESSSTSKRSVRPQTKILRRPTPNLNHPVIQVDSDDSSGDSGYSEKGKDDNPKRLKMGNESSESAHKPKNFIMYNKKNVEKNTKNAPKERTSTAVISPSIPNPCNSCSRSQAPERLHSHAKRDSRGLMNYRKSPSFDIKKSPTIDIKMASPHKRVEKVSETSVKAKTKAKDINPERTQQNHKENSVAHSASESSIAVCITKDSVLDTKKTCVDVTGEETQIVSEIASPPKDLLDITKKCYICEEEFKVSSLLMHESKCLESWKKTNNSLTPNLRKLPPRRPPEDSEEVADDPAWSAVQSQLLPCPVCGRTFFPERMPVHRRVCKGKPSPRTLKRAASLREPPTSSSEGEDQKRTTVYIPCYVCGHSYGSWVISMHEQQCLRKWRRENEKLPDVQQKEEPKRSTESSADDDVASLVELGDSAWESHLQQLVPCLLCQRTFFPDRLGVHERSCKGPTNSIRPKSNRGT